MLLRMMFIKRNSAQFPNFKKYNFRMIKWKRKKTKKKEKKLFHQQLLLGNSYINMMMMTVMNCFCGMVDRRKAFSLNTSMDHCQRSSPSRVSDTPRGRFEPAQTQCLSFVEWSCARAITNTPRHHNVSPYVSRNPREWSWRCPIITCNTAQFRKKPILFTYCRLRMLQKDKTFQPSHAANRQYFLYKSMFTSQSKKIKTRHSPGIHI